jgi:hypothetical protein
MQLVLRKRLERAQLDDLPATMDDATLAFFVMAVSQDMVVQAKAGASKKVLEEFVDYVLNVTEGLDPVLGFCFSVIFHLSSREISIRVETCGSERKQCVVNCGRSTYKFSMCFDDDRLSTGT